MFDADGKSDPNIFSQNVGFNGDEYHGIESVKNHQQKQTQGLSFCDFSPPSKKNLCTVTVKLVCSFPEVSG